jgi:hypothetical protein
LLVADAINIQEDFKPASATESAPRKTRAAGWSSAMPLP